MGRIFPIPALSTIADTFKASNAYLRANGSSEEIPMVKVPQIDFSKDAIIIWVPGTNDRHIPEHFKQYVRKMFPSNSLVMADYEASWNFSVSIPHGIFTLTSILKHIKKHKGRKTKVYLAGQSQGSLIVGEVMAKKEYSSLVNRAVLFSHPGISKHHYTGMEPEKVIEFNNPLDFTTFDWGATSEKEKEEIIKAVDSFMTGDVSKALYLLKVGITNPINSAWLGISSLRLLPVPFFKGIPAFHSVQNEDYKTAVGYLKYGLAAWNPES